VTTGLDDPDLLLDLVVTYTQLFFAIRADQWTFLFWTSCKVFWCFGWRFVVDWCWSWSSRFVAQVESYHVEV
jgi:hypothetical protein